MGSNPCESRLELKSMLGEWQGETSCISLWTDEPPVTRVTSSGQVRLEPVFLEEVDGLTEQFDKNNSSSTGVNSVRRPSKKVREAKKRDRMRLESCNFRESSSFGSYYTLRAGTVLPSDAGIMYPKLENGMEERRCLLLNGNLTVNFPTDLQQRGRWTISAGFYRPNGTRRVMTRSFGVGGDLVGVACGEESRS